MSIVTPTTISAIVEFATMAIYTIGIVMIMGTVIIIIVSIFTSAAASNVFYISL